MRCFEKNCDSYTTAFRHGGLCFCILKPMMGSGNSSRVSLKTAVQHELSASAETEEQGKPQYSASDRIIHKQFQTLYLL